MGMPCRIQAASVVQMLHLLITAPGALQDMAVLKDTGTMALIVSAACSSYKHTGFTDDFLIRTRHPLALKYNDTAIQANHAVSAAFDTMRSGLDRNPGEVSPGYVCLVPPVHWLSREMQGQ